MKKMLVTWSIPSIGGKIHQTPVNLDLQSYSISTSEFIVRDIKESLPIEYEEQKTVHIHNIIFFN